MSWFRRILNWIFGDDDAPAPAPHPVPSPVPVPVEPVPVDPHVPPDDADVEPAPGPPPPPDNGLHVRTKVNGQKVDIRLNDYGNFEPTMIVVNGKVGSRIPLVIEIEMDPLTDPGQYAELMEDFRDKIPLPGTCELIMTAHPRTAPRFAIGNVVAVGTVEGRPGGWTSELEDTPTYQHHYLANITTGLLRWRITTTLTVRSAGSSYAVIKGAIDANWGDERKRIFEVWLNGVREDF